MNIQGCDTVVLSFDELRQLVNGKFDVRKCTSCFGKGWYWVHEDGTIRDPNDGESEDSFYEHPCEGGDTDCGGVGFHIKFPDDEEPVAFEEQKS